MERDTPDEALDVFRSYTQAFQALDAAAVARHFHEPALLITPDEVVVVPSRADVEQAYSHIMSGLPAQGYAGTEFSQLDASRLSDDVALVTGAGVWKRSSGEEFAPFGITYTLRRAAGAWEIVVATIYQRTSSR